MNTEPICPVAPAGAAAFVSQITGHVVWGVLALFVISFVVSIGAILVGRIFNMPHSSKVGIVSIFVVVLAAIAYMVMPSIVDSILGSGCI